MAPTRPDPTVARHARARVVPLLPTLLLTLLLVLGAAALAQGAVPDAEARFDTAWRLVEQRYWNLARATSPGRSPPTTKPRSTR